MSKKKRHRSRTLKKRRESSSSIEGERLDYWLYLSLALIVPFVFLEGYYNYVDLPRALLIQIAVVAILLVWLLGAISRKELRIIRTPFDLPLLSFVVWAGLSLLWVHNFYEGFEIWMQWVACLILFFLTVNLVHSERDIRRLLAALLLAGTLVAVLGICQYLLDVNWVPQTRPPAATFANRNMASQFMVMTIPLAAGFFLLSRKRSEVLLTVVSLGVLGLFLFYASTRTAWLAVVVEFLLLTTLLARDHFKWKLTPPMGTNKKKALAVCAAVGFILINLTPAGFQWEVGTAVDRIREVLPGFESQPYQVSDELPRVVVEELSQGSLGQTADPGRDSLSVRVRLWRNTLRMGTEHFLKGVGVGNFSVLYPRYKRSAVVDSVFSGGGEWRRAHNDYVQIFAELGLVGLFFLGWLFFALIKACFALLGEETKGELRYLLMGIMAALLGLSLTAFFSFPFRLSTSTFMFAVYLGVLGGRYSRRQMKDENSAPQAKAFSTLPSWTAAVGVVLIFLLLLILLPFQYDRLTADGYYRRVVEFASQNDWSAVTLQAEEGYSYYPYRKDFLFQKGRAYLATGNVDGAIETTEEFLEAYPYHVNAHHNLAVAYVRKGDMDLAFQHFDRVLEIVPHYSVTNYVVAQIYEVQDELDKALKHYRLAVEDAGDNPQYREKLARLERLIESKRK